MSSEPGAVLRYTLDGSAPSTTSGAAYTGPVTVGVDRRLRVALVLPGGATAEVAHAYTVGRDRTRGADQAPATWTTTRGTTTGPPSALLVEGEPSGTMTVTAGAHKGALLASGWGALTLPAPAPTALSLSWAGSATAAGGTREVALWDWEQRSWTVVSAAPQPAVPSRHVLDVGGDVRRFVSSTGQVHVRLEGTAPKTAGTWSLVADQLTVRPTWG